MLKRNPTIIMPLPTIATNVNMRGSLRTFLRMIISGKDKAITDIINANEVPKEAPFSRRTDTMGTIPAALEYKGIPMRVDNGTAYHWSFPINEAIISVGTYP